MEEVFIDGVAQSKFGKDERPLEDMIVGVATEALDNSNKPEPDVVIIGNFNYKGYVGQASLDALVGEKLGLPSTVPKIQIDRGSSTGAAAVELGYLLAQGGKKVLVVSGEKMRVSGGGDVTEETSKVVHKSDRILGVTMPVIAGLATSEYMKHVGISEKKLREIFFEILNQNRKNGAMNPDAYLKNQISRDDYFHNIKTNEADPKNPWVAWPLTRNDCGGTYNGAAAVMLTPIETDLHLAGINSAHSSVSINGRRTLISLDSTVNAAGQLYKATGIMPADIDIVDLHDAFAPVPVLAAEDLGIAERGKGADLALLGKNKYGKRVFYNLSGGFLCKTHPIAASGTAQLVELTYQMRGQSQYGKIIGSDLGNVNVGLWFSMHGFGFYNVVGIVEKTGRSRNSGGVDESQLPENYQLKRRELPVKGGERLVAITNLPKPIEVYGAIGAARTEEGKLQLGLLKEFNPEYLGKRINTSNEGYRVGFEPVTESIFDKMAGRFSGGLREVFGMFSRR